MKLIKACISLLLFTFVLSAEAYPVVCDINAYDFYTRAQKKGWRISCNLLGDRLGRFDFLQIPPSVGCFGNFGWLDAKRTCGMAFNARGAPMLSGGWRVTGLDAELFWKPPNSSSWLLVKPPSYPEQLRTYIESDRFIMDFRASGAFNNYRIKIILKKVEVQKRNGNCRAFYSEAF